MIYSIISTILLFLAEKKTVGPLRGASIDKTFPDSTAVCHLTAPTLKVCMQQRKNIFITHEVVTINDERY